MLWKKPFALRKTWKTKKQCLVNWISGTTKFPSSSFIWLPLTNTILVVLSVSTPY
jgi:hypothetical protein